MSIFETKIWKLFLRILGTILGFSWAVFGLISLILAGPLFLYIWITKLVWGNNTSYEK